MKKLIITAVALLSVIVCPAQSKKDTVKLDTSHVEKIKKMPMDTVSPNMPVKPFPPHEENKNGKKVQPMRKE